MQWPLEKFKLFGKFVLSMLLVAPSIGFTEVDLDRLWIPAKHQTLFIDLKKAANAAESIRRCVTVLQGTLDLDHSSANHPVYRILCRQENGKSYNEMVDGITFETLTTVQEAIVPPTPEELERQRMEEERKKAEALDKRKERNWLLCLEEFDLKTKYMIELKRVQEERPEPDVIDDAKVEFTIDFNSHNTQGQLLKYKAFCHTVDEKVSFFKIKGRTE